MAHRSLYIMSIDTTTNSPVKPKIALLEEQSSIDLNKVLRGMLHRRALEFHLRLRQVKATLKNNRQRLVFDYIFNNTIGFNKLSDPISLSQFEQGKRNNKTSEIIDTGCGLSHNPIRQARKELIQLGLIVEQSVSDKRGASQANHYTIRFVVEMVEAEIAHKKMKHMKRHTPTPYQSQVATIKLPTEVIKQRCISSKAKKKSASKKHYMHREHVDYLVNQIETVTGDKHSRGGFAQIALTLPEDILMNLLHKLKDRANIKNKGAWFIKASSHYIKKRVIKADRPPEEPPKKSKLIDWKNSRSQLTKNLSMDAVLGEQNPLPIYEQRRLLRQMNL